MSDTPLQSIAARKRDENIVEYLLYVWQMEDLLRGTGFDHQKLSEFLGSGMSDPQILAVELKWLEELAGRMKEQGVEAKGHVREVEEVLAELVYLHRTLLGVIKDATYTAKYGACEPAILDLMQRSNGSARNEVEACLTGIYGLLMLRLRNQDVSEDTEKTLKDIAGLLALLAASYKSMRGGESKATLN